MWIPTALLQAQNPFSWNVEQQQIFCLAEWRLVSGRKKSIMGAVEIYSFPSTICPGFGTVFSFPLRYLKWLSRCSEFGVGPNFQYFALLPSRAHCNLIDSFYCVNILAVHSRAAIVPNWPFYDPVHMPRDQKPTPAIVECTGIVKTEFGLSHQILKVNYH